MKFDDIIVFPLGNSGSCCLVFPETHNLDVIQGFTVYGFVLSLSPLKLKINSCWFFTVEYRFACVCMFTALARKVEVKLPRAVINQSVLVCVSCCVVCMCVFICNLV